MQWLTVAWWRWRLAQALARNPLVRTSDRIEVAVMALAVAVSLVAMPVALAIGTAVHDEHARAYTAEQHDRHRIVATTTDDSASSPRGAVAAVQARLAGRRCRERRGLHVELSGERRLEH